MSCVPNTLQLLEDRESEVSGYLAFLKVAVERRATLSAKDGGLIFPLSMDLTHTLKANSLLLLYSAMEATLVQLLDEMHEEIGANCNSTDELNGELLRLVLRTVKKDADAQVLSASSPLHQSLFNYWIGEWRGKSTGKEKRVDGISGSVDSVVFYDQLKKFGVVGVTANGRPPQHLTHYALQKVKNNRNELAHGEKSFVDLGRNLAVEELDSDAKAVFETLRKIAAEIDVYLFGKRYLACPPPEVPVPAPVPLPATTEA